MKSEKNTVKRENTDMQTETAGELSLDVALPAEDTADSDTDDGKSKFVGKKSQYYFKNLFFILTSLISVSLLYPVAFFNFERWKTDNSFIDGKKLKFTGRLLDAYLIYISGLICTAGCLFLINLVLYFIPYDLNFLNGALSSVATAINAFFITNRLRRWKKENVHYDGFLPGDSFMQTNLLKCVMMNIGSYLIGIFTLGFGYPLIFKRKEAYYTDLSVVDGNDIELRGSTSKLYGKWLLGIFLCIVTLGFFIPMVNYFLYKWTAENTHSKASSAQP